MLTAVSCLYTQFNVMEHAAHEVKVTPDEQGGHELFPNRNSTTLSIEARVPSLDYRIIEFAMRLSPEYKSATDWTKLVLRKVANPNYDDVSPGAAVKWATPPGARATGRRTNPACRGSGAIANVTGTAKRTLTRLAMQAENHSDE